MKLGKAAKIAYLAAKSIEDFTSVWNKPARFLLPRKNEGVHAELRDYAYTMVLNLHDNDWDNTVGYQSKKIAKTLPLVQVCSIESLTNNQTTDLSGYGSWLYFVRPGQYAVVYDDARIRNTCIDRRKNEDECRVKLFLHELGHLKLHWSILFNELLHIKYGYGMATSAAAELEEEAWFFAGCILGLCAGDRAYKAKSHTLGYDDSWIEW